VVMGGGGLAVSVLGGVGDPRRAGLLTNEKNSIYNVNSRVLISWRVYEFIHSYSSN
jgi:hypothetical protein